MAWDDSCSLTSDSHTKIDTSFQLLFSNCPLGRVIILSHEVLIFLPSLPSRVSNEPSLRDATSFL